MSITLLLADDSITAQRVVELTFADEDVRVVAVGSGDSAIAWMDRTPPDIVLADAGMPDGDGFAVARHVRDTPALAHIPVVLLTGPFEPVDNAAALEAGCRAVLTKPLEPRALVQRVKQLMGVSPDDRGAQIEAEAPGDRPRPVARLDDYFEELDRALAARAGEGPTAPPEPAPEPASLQVAVRADSAKTGEPVLAGAFSALLAAEQSGAAPDAFTDWLPDEALPPVISEDVIDAIVGRVLGRLSDTAVRDAVSAIASATAERLVREEIERIKSNIK